MNFKKHAKSKTKFLALFLIFAMTGLYLNFLLTPTSIDPTDDNIEDIEWCLSTKRIPTRFILNVNKWVKDDISFLDLFSIFKDILKGLI